MDCVDKGYQNQGIATKLVEMWEAESKKRGAHCLMLCTEKRNLQFYKRRGFTYMGLNPKGYFGAKDYWFYKIIREPKEENYLRTKL